MAFYCPIKQTIGEKWAKKVFPNETKAKAKEMLWSAILKAARVDDDPVAAWKAHTDLLADKCAYLNSKRIKTLHYTAPGTDLTVELVKNHIFETLIFLSAQPSTGTVRRIMKLGGMKKGA